MEKWTGHVKERGEWRSGPGMCRRGSGEVDQACAGGEVEKWTMGHVLERKEEKWSSHMQEGKWRSRPGMCRRGSGEVEQACAGEGGVERGTRDVKEKDQIEGGVLEKGTKHAKKG